MSDAEKTLAAWPELVEAMWAGNEDRLRELADCRCCCDEHTFPYCEARLWGGCRGGQPYGWGPEEEFGEAEAWRAFYGMTKAEFYGLDHLIDDLPEPQEER